MRPYSLERSSTYSDNEYIAGVQQGDEAVFTALVHAYLTPLTRFAYGFSGGEDSAHDVVQEVFAHVWQLGPDWYPQTGVAAYLFTAVRNRALNAIKSGHARKRMQETFRAQIESFTTGTDPYADVALTILIRKEFQRLTERQQTAVRLRFEQGMTTSQVATILGIEPKTAEKLFARALGTLRMRLRHLRDDFN